MKITNSDITKAKKLSACTKGIKWAESLNGAELTNKNVEAACLLWAIKNKCYTRKLDLDLLDYCVKEDPWDALAYAAKYLAPEQLAYCAEKAPWDALEYAAKYLAPEQLDYCTKKSPMSALEYAAKYLTPEQLDYCVKKKPGHALAYAAKYLAPELLDYCKKRMAQ